MAYRHDTEVPDQAAIGDLLGVWVVHVREWATIHLMVVPSLKRTSENVWFAKWLVATDRGLDSTVLGRCEHRSAPLVALFALAQCKKPGWWRNFRCSVLADNGRVVFRACRQWPGRSSSPQRIAEPYISPRGSAMSSKRSPSGPLKYIDVPLANS